jgi:anti-sigma factor RsiW
MLDVLRRIEEGDKTNEPGVHSTGNGGGAASVTGRLGHVLNAEVPPAAGRLAELAARIRAGSVPVGAVVLALAAILIGLLIAAGAGPPLASRCRQMTR